MTYQEMIKSCREFWKEHPALYAGLHMLLGAASAAKIRTPLIFILLALHLPLFGSIKCKRTLIQSMKGLLFFGGTFLYAYTAFNFPSLNGKQEKGTIHFSISSLSQYVSPFKQKTPLYKGIIKTFKNKEHTYANIPCSILLKKTTGRPLANSDYQIEGTLIEKEQGYYQFKPSKDSVWEKIPRSFSFAELRYAFKEKVRSHIKKHISHPKSAAFLSSLATGDIDERELAFEFSKLGLSHILAVSGFHFGLITFFFSVFLRFFFSPKKTALLLLTLSSFYFFFIGNAPSVQRAWLAIALALMAQLLNLSYNALNGLGTALIVAIALNPLVVSHLGFQLSFLSTLAILLLYPLSEKIVSYLLPQRTLKEILTFSLLDQHGFLLSSFLRKALALNIAVHCVAIPSLLVLFHKFPLLSFVYNLFFPLGVTISLFLFLIATGFLFIIPPLGNLLHALNSSFTAALLKLTSNPPSSFDFFIYAKALPLEFLFLFFALLLIAGISFNTKKALSY